MIVPTIKVSSGKNILIYNIDFNEMDIPTINYFMSSFKNSLAEVLASQRYSQKFIDTVLNNTSVDATPKSIRITIKNEVMPTVELGRQEKTMYYLRGKTVPINSFGRIIFRKVTERSLLRGKWRQRRVEGKKLVRGAIVNTLQEAVMYTRMFSPEARSATEWITRSLQNLLASKRKSPQ